MTVPIASREAVVVPRPNLHETHATFEQSSRDQTLATEVFNLFRDVDFVRILFAGRVQAIHLHDVLGLAGQVECFGGAQLHLGRQLIRTNSSFETRVITTPLLIVSIQLI